MIDNYSIILQRGNKTYRVSCEDNIITLCECNRTIKIVDMDNDKKMFYWIKCLNKIRKHWVITSAYNIPNFCIDSKPCNLYDYKFVTHIHNLKNKHCVLIPNSTTYHYDHRFKHVWESRIIQSYIPIHIFNTLVDNIFYDIEFSYNQVETSQIYLLPLKLCHIELIQNMNISFINIPPQYKCFTDARCAIHQYPYLWKYIRIFNGDHVIHIDINVFLKQV